MFGTVVRSTPPAPEAGALLRWKLPSTPSPAFGRLFFLAGDLISRICMSKWPCRVQSYTTRICEFPCFCEAVSQAVCSHWNILPGTFSEDRPLHAHPYPRNPRSRQCAIGLLEPTNPSDNPSRPNIDMLRSPRPKHVPHAPRASLWIWQVAWGFGPLGSPEPAGLSCRWARFSALNPVTGK